METGEATGVSTTGESSRPVEAVGYLGPQLSARDTVVAWRRGYKIGYERDGYIVAHHAGPVGNLSSKEAVG